MMTIVLISAAIVQRDVSCAIASVRDIIIPHCNRFMMICRSNYSLLSSSRSILPKCMPFVVHQSLSTDLIFIDITIWSRLYGIFISQFFFLHLSYSQFLS
jgi:hypothetical protein